MINIGDRTFAINEDGEMSLYEPYATLDIMSEDDYYKLQSTLRIATAIEKAFENGYCLTKPGHSITSLEELEKTFAMEESQNKIN